MQKKKLILILKSRKGCWSHIWTLSVLSIYFEARILENITTITRGWDNLTVDEFNKLFSFYSPFIKTINFRKTDFQITPYFLLHTRPQSVLKRLPFHKRVLLMIVFWNDSTSTRNWGGGVRDRWERTGLGGCLGLIP